MHNFRTTFEIAKAKIQIGYSSKIMMFGSCFTENIGQKLCSLLYNIDQNPFGILYNPASISKSIDFILELKQFTIDDLFFANERWHSYSHHSRFSDSNSNNVINQINNRLKFAHTFVQKADVIFITFGTARIYQNKNNQEIVSNCHKQPASYFNQKLLEPSEIITNYTELINKILQINSKIKIIFTISPIRHWKDGAYGNQISKSILFVAIHKLLEKFSCTDYFPSYEIQMDDLRDYRFYDEDMLHPNKQAIEYIWEKFKQSYLAPEEDNLQKEIEKLVAAQNHKPVNTKSEAYKKFLTENLTKVQKLSQQHADINFEKIINHFSNSIVLLG